MDVWKGVPGICTCPMQIITTNLQGRRYGTPNRLGWRVLSYDGGLWDRVSFNYNSEGALHDCLEMNMPLEQDVEL